MSDGGRAVWVRVCDHPGCPLTITHKHGMTDQEWAAYLEAEAARDA